MADETILIDLKVKGGDAALKEAANLNVQIRSNKEQIKELSKEYDKNAVEIQQLNNENKKLGAEQRNLAKSASSAKGSYNALSTEMAELKRRQKEVNVTTAQGQKEFAGYGKRINDINGKLKRLDATNGVHTRNVGNYTGAIKDAAGQLNIMGVNVGMVASQFTTATTAIRASSSAIGGTNKMLKLLKIAIASTGIGLLVIALASLVTYFKSTQEGGETIRVLFKQIGQVVNVLAERLGIFGKGLVQFLSGDFSAGIDTMKSSFQELGDELEREVSLIAELERRAIKLEKTEILLNAQRSITKRNIKELQLLAEQETTSQEAKVSAIEKAIKLQADLNRIEENLQKQKIKNLLGETVGQEKLNFVLQQINEGFGSIAEASNKADAIISMIGLDPSNVDDLDELVNLVVTYYDQQSNGLKLERTLTTKLNEVKNRQKSGVKGVVKEKEREDLVTKAQLEAESALLDEVIADIEYKGETSVEWGNQIIDKLHEEITAREENKNATNAELEAERAKRKQVQETFNTIETGFDTALQVSEIYSQFQQSAMNRELAMAGENAEKRAEIEKRYAKQQQKIAIGQAIIRGALAIQRIASDVPKADFGITTAILIGLQAAATAAQVATISSQKFKQGGEVFPSKEGGMIQGASHSFGGVKFKAGGKVHEAEGNEIILTRGVARNPTLRKQASRLNVLGGGRRFAMGGTLSGATAAQLNTSATQEDQTRALISAMSQQRTVLSIPTATATQKGIQTVETNATL
mgnify:FL=1